MVADAASGIELLVVDTEDGGWRQLLDLGDGERVEPMTGGEDLAALLYTSGTSGRPRGAMLTHRALLANLDQLVAHRPAGRRNR